MSEVLFEDRSSYDPKKDPVERISLVVECAPGQAVSVVEHLSSVKTKAGVYCVTLNEEQDMSGFIERLEALETHVAESVGSRLMEFGESIESLGERMAGIEEHPALSVPPIPAAAPVAGPELEQSDTVSPPSTVAAVDEQGDTHGEQSIQFSDSNDSGNELGRQGSDAETGAAPAVESADGNSGLSGVAGAGTEAGSLERDS